MQCLDDETVLAYLQRRLSGSAAVEHHLDRCAACRRLIAALASTSLLRRTSGAPPSAWASDFLPPGVAIGRYVVEARIGSGATGIVYRAHDPELGRAVAIKQLRTDVAGDPQLRERFIVEARTVARLSHPNVVPVYDVGVHDEHLFVAMELVDGVTLRRCVADRRREQILELYRQAARGLVAAHECGICHGDFKPDNVLVTREGRVLVADFGLLGSPAYMAPELLDGAPPSAAADQFAWCVALFEALTGHRPFAGDSIAALQRSIHRGGVAPAMHRLPRWLQAVLRRGLAVDPSQRFPSLAALAAALDRRRRSVRWPLTAVALAAVALVIVPTTRARPTATENETIEAVAVESESLRAAEDALARGRLSEAREHTHAALADAQTRGNEAAAAAALVLRGRIEALTGPIDIALQSLTDAHAIATANGATDVTADAATEIARILAFDGERPDEAAEWIRHAEVALQRHGDDPQRAQTLASSVATLDMVRERFDDARRGFERVLEAYAQRSDVDAAARASAEINLGTVLARMGRVDEAIGLHEAALELMDHAGLESHPTYGRALLSLGNAESKLRRFEAARDHNERALAILTEALGPDAILVGRAAHNLGSAEIEVGNIDAAARAVEQGEAVLTRALGPQHPVIANVLVGLARIDLQRGDLLPARERLERAAGILERAHGLDDLSLVPILGNLGDLARILGDGAGSQRHCAKVLEVLERVHGPEHPNLANPLEDLANALMGNGDLDQAERLLERAYAIRSKAVPSDDPSLYHYWLATGKLHLERGDHDLADTALEHAASIAEDRPRLSAVELARGEGLWRAGHRKQAIATVRRARQTLGDDPSQKGLAQSIDGWLVERVGSAT